MNNPFIGYAEYYDLFYTTKNYAEECNYIEALVEKFSRTGEKKLMDLGCGTGGHSLILEDRGWDVTGIDRSGGMIKNARKKAGKKKVKFIHSDITNYKINGKFDAIISMFAVVSYITFDDGLMNFFKLISKHLKKNGVMIFDAWYGPAVLHDKPSDRFRIIEQGNKRLIRFVKSKLDIEKNIVDVNINVLEITDKKLTAEVDEIHPMRYYFVQDLKLILSSCGLKLVAYYPFLKLSGQPTEDDWNVTFIVGKK